jgi:protein O-mannosyl-transferase
MTSRRRARREAARSNKQLGGRPPATGKRSNWNVGPEGVIVAAMLTTVVSIIYLQVQSFGFISLDDPQYVSANPMVLGGLTSDSIKWAFAFNSSFYWHPLTWMSHMLDVEMFGPEPGAHHLVNAVLHAANAVVIFAALRSMTKDTVKSAVAAALFAIHPLHVESVAWISERKDVLSTFFWSIALLAYALYARDRDWRWMLAVNIAFVFGLLAKPMILTLPFVLLLLDFWPLGRRGIIDLVREKLSLFALAIASVFVTMLSQRNSSAVVALEKFSLFDRLGNVAVSYVLYLRDMLWPTQLAAFYPLHSPTVIGVAGALLLLIGITVVVIRLRRSHPYLIVGWFWYLGTLVPAVGIIQAGDQGRADRFTYVPLIGIFVAIVWLCSALAMRSRLARQLMIPAPAAILIAFVVMSHRQAATWANDLTLWERAVAVTQNNYRAENLYGVALTDRGRLNEGIMHYEAAIRIWPAYPEAHNNLGTARMEQRDYVSAVNEFAAAKRERPRFPMFSYNLAVALDAAGRRAEAKAIVDSALRFAPDNPDLKNAWTVLGGAERK